MSAPLEDLPSLMRRHWVPPVGVIHVGAHRGEEVPTYTRCGFAKITLVEADPDLAQALTIAHADDPDITVLALACADEPEGKATFVRHAPSTSSGLRQVEGLEVQAVMAVPCAPLRDIQGGHNVAVIDTQGTELDVLASADLRMLDVVIVETTRNPAPRQAASWAGVNRHMAAAGWEHVDDWPHENGGWIDSVYLRLGRYEP